MSRYPLAESNEFPLQEPARRELAESPHHALQDIAAQPTMPFFGFSYTYTELRAAGGRTHVTSRTTRFHDGKLVAESFDGELDGEAYGRAVRAATDTFAKTVAAQMSLLLAPFSWLLPGGRGDRR